jgi:hypothetical protein
MIPNGSVHISHNTFSWTKLRYKSIKEMWNKIHNSYLKKWINIPINIKPAKLTVKLWGSVKSNLFLQKNGRIWITSLNLALNGKT